MHLRAIAANGNALAERLTPLLACDFDVCENGGEWLAFASAAKAAFPFRRRKDATLLKPLFCHTGPNWRGRKSISGGLGMDERVLALLTTMAMSGINYLWLAKMNVRF